MLLQLAVQDIGQLPYIDVDAFLRGRQPPHRWPPSGGRPPALDGHAAEPHEPL